MGFALPGLTFALCTVTDSEGHFQLVFRVLQIMAVDRDQRHEKQAYELLQNFAMFPACPRAEQQLQTVVEERLQARSNSNRKHTHRQTLLSVVTVV